MSATSHHLNSATDFMEAAAGTMGGNGSSSGAITSAKVAEVFLTAGHAFQKLGDLAMRLQAPISEHSDETNWSNAEVEMLKESLTRFAHDLENISAMVQARTIRNIKTDIKRSYNSVANSTLLQAPLTVDSTNGGQHQAMANSAHYANYQSPATYPLAETFVAHYQQPLSSRVARGAFKRQYSHSPELGGDYEAVGGFIPDEAGPSSSTGPVNTAPSPPKVTYLMRRHHTGAHRAEERQSPTIRSIRVVPASTLRQQHGLN